MSDVWVVSEGFRWEGYTTIGVFTSKELALKVADRRYLKDAPHEQDMLVVRWTVGSEDGPSKTGEWMFRGGQFSRDYPDTTSVIEWEDFTREET